MLADNYIKELKTSSGCGAAPALNFFTLQPCFFKKKHSVPAYRVTLALGFWLDNSYTFQCLNQSKWRVVRVSALGEVCCRE